MPLLSSCLNFCQTFINFCQICHFYKIVIFQNAHFCHLICIWPNPWTLPLSRNLPFSPKFPFSCNRHLSRFPSLSPHLRFCQTFDGFLPNYRFSQFANFVKSLTFNIAGLHLTSRRPCWWSRTKAFVSSGSQTLMLILREELYCIDRQHGRLVRLLMNPNSPISQNLSFS